MTNEEIINKLRDDKHYYGEFGRQYISNSDIKTILYDPEQFGVPMDENENLARGRLFHQLMLEPDKVKDFPLYDGAVRNASYRQFLQENDLKFALKVSEADEVKAMVDWFKSNDNKKTQQIMELIYNKDCRFEEPMVADILGHKFKGKADVVNIKDGYIIDLKTSIDVSRFKNTFKSYGYHTQSYLYQTMFGMPLIFIVIGKTPKKRKDGTIYYDIGKVKTSPNTLHEGKEAVEKAIMTYEEWLSSNSDKDIQEFIFEFEI
tara:strand:- start:3812 stop:4594 length:783 start_codon:yes stop_codon:yes gene_type:complete